MATRFDTSRRFDSPASPPGGDRLARLCSLWQAFERSGSISAYIAYRLHLSRLIRFDPDIRPPTGAPAS